MKNLIKKAIDRAMNSGADSCDIIISSGEAMSLSAQDGKLDQYEISQTGVLGLRVIKNNKIGLSYSESFDEDAIMFATKSALENADFSDTNEYESIVVKNPKDYIFNDSLLNDTSSNEEKIEFTLKLESEVKKRDPRVQSTPYNGLSISNSRHIYMNSLGTYTEQGNGSFSAYTSALVKEGDVNSMHYAPFYAKDFHKLDLNQCVEECLEHSINWLKAKPVASGKYDVIFDTDTLAQMMNVFSNFFSAKDAIEKTNPWETKMGQLVAAEGFTLMDVTQYKDAFTKHYIDSEGMLTKDLTLIENGVLKSFYHNTATAKYFGVTSTGHASRGPRTSLNVSASNWLIKPGVLKNEDVQGGVYLEIIEVMGLNSGGDSISGDFSFGAGGYLCKNGKRIQPVKEITVAGNFNKLLLGASRIGNTLIPNHSMGTFSPLVRFSDLYVAGI